MERRRVLAIGRSTRIPVGEVAVRFGPSGGPGGQHANRAHTRVELRFDIAGSPSLTPSVRGRLLDRFGSELRVVVDEERSQARNRAIAFDRLVARMSAALRAETPRRPTAPSRSARERRMADKRRRGEVKRARRRPAIDE